LEKVSHILATDNNLPISFEKEILSQMKRQISFYKKYNKIEGDEILKTIKVDILIGNIEYKDQFEWDINNPENDPEEFARNVCIDLGLGNEFVVRITHSIREQILEYQKAANNERNNYFYGGNYYRQPNKKNVVDTNNYIREIFTENSEWDPEVKHINEEEIKKFEKKEERKNRYAQRKK
jgi:SWI/SNF-related matrix-associated actin-dependent regulator of chromatin subfamily B protein 1